MLKHTKNKTNELLKNNKSTLKYFGIVSCKTFTFTLFYLSENQLKSNLNATSKVIKNCT